MTMTLPYSIIRTKHTRDINEWEKENENECSNTKDLGKVSTKIETAAATNANQHAHL